MTDGRRDCITQTIPSALSHLQGPVDGRIIHDDSGDAGYRRWLGVTFPDFEIVGTPTRQGFAGAYASAWRHLSRLPYRWVFATEDDFVFLRPVDLAAVAGVMAPRPHLTQMALRRQPCNAAEHAAGGVVELNPGAYIQMHDYAGRAWLEHQQFWTTNPALYRRSLCGTGWPVGANSEGQFTHRLLAHGTPEVAGGAAWFGYWGAKSSGVWVQHIGHQRVGVGY
jgi:hypothetical protein